MPDEGGGKRKANDISTLSEQEEEWVALHKLAPAKIALPISPALSPISMNIDKAEIEMPVLPKVDVTAVMPGPEVRAPKRRRLRKMAERLGYAALGGVTAGAMIVGTLIYTAPAF